ncbi:MAG: UDP-N-acetylmuramyl tripeptide synthetase [Isosphaeraceae bacterium]|nr:UDP-N-acetylmuramyl tripeptide synthetase [Isosphaeraceae bacterium]
MARWFVDRSAQRGIPSISLRRLLPDAIFLGCRDLMVSGCSSDSRHLEPGEVFVALRGARHDGHAFVGRAVERGAAAVVVERPCPQAGGLQVIVSDSRQALARICHALAGDPAEQLRVVGVAGAAGKAATALFLRAIIEATGRRCGLVSSLGWSDGLHSYPAGPAAPGAEALAEMLAVMVERESRAAVLAFDEEALDRHAAEGITFEGAIITGVRGPRSEAIEATERRRRSLARLVRRVAPEGPVVVNADDPDAELLGAVHLEARPVSFGLGRPADIRGVIERLDASGSRFRLLGLDHEVAVDLKLIGSRAISSALAAAALAWSRGYPTEAIVAGLESIARVPGRLEPVLPGAPVDVWTDRAPSRAALHDALDALRDACPGRLLCVLGPHSDLATSLELARAAEVDTARLILTSDGSEAPLEPLLGALRRPGQVLVEPDRRRAIEAALAEARPGDAVLIVGRGIPYPCDDRAIAAAWLRRATTERRRSA